MEGPENAELGAPTAGSETLEVTRSRWRNAASMSLEAVQKASATVSQVGADAAGRAKAGLRKLDENHEAVADHADSIAKVTRIAAGVTVAGAAVAAPTGLTAVGVALGIVGAPLVVTAAPVLVAVAGCAITASAAASLYSKARRKRHTQEQANKESNS